MIIALLGESATGSRKTWDLPSIDFDVFEPRPAPRSETLARLIYALQESRIVLEPILEPIVFRSETDEYSSRLAVTRNDDFLTFCLAEVARQIVFDFGERNLLHSGFPNCASHASASLFMTIARTWTVFPITS